MPKAQTFFTIIGIMVIVYLAGALLIAKYLERQHTQVWDRLGRPSFLNWGIANTARLWWAVFVGSSLVHLKDRKLSTLVWTERVLFLVILAGTVVWVVHYNSGHPMK